MNRRLWAKRCKLKPDRTIPTTRETTNAMCWVGAIHVKTEKRRSPIRLVEPTLQSLTKQLLGVDVFLLVAVAANGGVDIGIR